MQLGDALPGAVQVFARAMDMTEAQLFKAMESGSVLASEALPRVAKEYRKAAIAGGAYDLALQGLRVTEGQFVTESQRAGKIIFSSGFEDGLSRLYKTMSRLLKDGKPQLEKLGYLFGKLFDGISYAIKVLEPILKIVIDNFELIFGAIAITKIARFSGVIKTFADVTAMNLARAFLPITAALMAAEELVSLFTDDIAGSMEQAMGMQINLREWGATSRLNTDASGKMTRGQSLDPKVSRIFEVDYKSMIFGDKENKGVTSSNSTVTNHNSFTVTGLDQYKEIEQYLANVGYAGQFR